MGEAYLDWQKKTSGIKLNDVIEEYRYVAAGKKIKAGDLVNYINGVASKVDYGESVDTQLSTETNAGYTISAVALDNNRVFIAHSYGSSYYLYGVVVTIDGASITYGADTKIDGTSQSGHEISACLLPNGNVFIAHSSSGSYYLYGIVVSIDGTTITKGTDTSIVGASYTGYTISTCLLPNGNVFIAHSHTGDSYRLAAIVCTISGTTISKGTDTSINISTNYAGYTISACLLPNGNVFIAHSYSSNYHLYGIVCSISGTTITAGSDTQLSTTSYTGFIISTVTLDKNRIFIAHSYSTSYHLYGIVCTIDGTTISKGTDTLLKNDSSEGATISTCLLPNGNIFIAHRYGTAAQNLFIYGLICNISGTTITAGIDTALVSSSHAGFTISSLLLNSDTIFIAHYIDSSAYLYAQLFGIDEANNVPTNQISITEYEQQVTPAIEPPFNAVALSSGVGAPEYVEIEGLIKGNIFPTTWTKVTDTEYVAEDGTILTVSSLRSVTSYPISNMFDDDIATSWSSPHENVSWAKIEFPTAKKITKMLAYVYNWDNSAKILGSNDNEIWTTLYEFTSNHTSLENLTLENTDFYKFYKIEFLSNTATYHYIYEWQTSEYWGLSQIPSTEHNEQVKIARPNAGVIQ